MAAEVEPAVEHWEDNLSPKASASSKQQRSPASASAPSGTKRKRAAASPKPKPRRMWTTAEEIALEKGVQKHGAGKWKKIQ